MYKKHIEVFFLPRRSLERLGGYTQLGQEGLPIAQIHCHPLLGCKHSQCRRLIASYAGFYDQYCRTPQDSPQSSKNKLTLHAIDLGAYSSPSDYEEKMTARNSFFGRNIKRAKKSGFWVAPFAEVEKAIEMDAISRSVRMRSFGPVFHLSHFKAGSSKKRGPTSKLNLAGASENTCEIHWEMLFGVFEGPKTSVEESHLLAYARLHRIGNIISYDELIGHGKYLQAGAVKLLHLQIIQWLLDAKDPSTQGVEYLVHGTVERGNTGFFFWKKKALFKPYLIELVDFELPADFDQARYFRLNPDVQTSHIPPQTHYKIHGKMEGRLYK